MLQLADEYPALFFFAIGSERRSPGWRLNQTAEKEFKHRYSSFELNPLTDEDAGRLVGNLIEIADVPPTIQTLIHQGQRAIPSLLKKSYAVCSIAALLFRKMGRRVGLPARKSARSTSWKMSMHY